MEINLIQVGVIVVVVGFVLLLIGTFSQTKGKTKVEGGGVVFIGPIPIIGATSEKSLYVVLSITVIFLLFIVVVNLLGR